MDEGGGGVFRPIMRWGGEGLQLLGEKLWWDGETPRQTFVQMNWRRGGSNELESRTSKTKRQGKQHCAWRFTGNISDK